MSTPLKAKELEYTDRALREEYGRAKHLLEVMPEPGSDKWDVYVVQQYLIFKESGG